MLIEFKREFNPSMTISLIGLHAACVIAVAYWWEFGFYAVSWVVAAIRTIGGGLGVSIWYHRYLTHQSFSCKSKTLSYFMIYWGGLYQDAKTWVANHLSHHAHTDSEQDPHSQEWPYNGGLRGFLWSHMVWLFYRFTPPDRFLKHPSLQDQTVIWEHKWHVLIVASGFILPCIIGGLYGISTAGHVGFLIYGFDALLASVVSMVFSLHVTWLINSSGHMFGWRARKQGDLHYAHDSSRDNPLLALISFGEGNHGSHHKNPASPRIGWLDPSWPVILLLKNLGLISLKVS